MLGPIQVVTGDGIPADLPSVSQRRLLAILALHAPRRVRAELLAEVLGVSASGLRTGVCRLRKALGDGALVAAAGGYRLTTDVDTQRFCRAVAHRSALAEALALWFGPAFDEFAHEGWAAAESARLTELHAGATEDHAEELVTAGRWSDAVALLAEHVASHPLRDSARGLLLRALAGAGRQAEALAAYRDYRTMLAEEVGTAPSPEVRRIAERVAGGWNGSRTTPVPRAAG